MEDGEHTAHEDNTVEGETRARGAAAPPLLPPLLLALEKAQRDAITARTQAVHRLRRAMKRAEEQGAGAVNLPDPRIPAEVAL